ncbi:MAG: (Fe-S)-binding protein, partial [Chromatiales bacterium]|nr:(Fe-S)-binding protein [Chromatiales bacterium]
MFPMFLQRNLDRLRPHLKVAIPKRVALHKHPGGGGVTEAIVAILSEIPELEVVTLPVPRLGFSLGSMLPIAVQRPALLAKELATAETAGIDVLAGIYHSDHREIVSHHPYWLFDVINYMELVGQSMGISHTDTFEQLKTMRDVDAVMRECTSLMEEHGLSADEVRDALE